MKAIRVLVVDDEWLDLEGLRDQLPIDRYPGMLVSTAKNAVEALRLMEQERFHILFTDIQMPGMTGMDLAQVVHEKWPEIAIVFVSGYDDFEYARKAIQLRAVYYLLKPVEDKELLAALNLAVAYMGNGGTGDGPDELAVDSGISRCIAQRVKECVNARLAQPSLTLKSISDELHYTPNHLGKLFHEGTGVKFTDFLVTCRMQKAAELIRQFPEMRISEVAESVGYQDSNAFTRQFCAIYQVTPMKYRGQKE